MHARAAFFFPALSYLCKLQQLLEDRGLFSSTNLVVMSDHGYTPLQKEEQFFMEQCLPDYSLVKKVVNSHSMIMVFTDPEDEGTVSFVLEKGNSEEKHKNFSFTLTA